MKPLERSEAIPVPRYGLGGHVLQVLATLDELVESMHSGSFCSCHLKSKM
jgi:hypothetical protein